MVVCYHYRCSGLPHDFSLLLMKKIFALVVLNLFGVATQAQCVMCRAMTDSNTTLGENGSNIGEGLNNGILYLMAIPYILISTLLLVFFRHKIKGYLLGGRS